MESVKLIQKVVSSPELTYTPPNENQNYFYLFIRAVNKNDDNKVAHFLQDPEINVNDVGADGYAAIHKATRVAGDKVIKLLLDKGANINKLSPR
jgi:ankyrin repeat protein